MLTSRSSISLAIRRVRRSGQGIHRLVTLSSTVRQLVKENDQRLLELPDSNDDDSDDPQAPPQDPEELARR